MAAFLPRLKIDFTLNLNKKTIHILIFAENSEWSIGSRRAVMNIKDFFIGNFK